MAKLICRVFATPTALRAHLLEAIGKGATNVNHTRYMYDDPAGIRHCCFVVRSLDDACVFMGYEFFAHEIHGDFHHLSPDDFKMLQGMLRQRTRHVPEVA